MLPAPGHRGPDPGEAEIRMGRPQIWQDRYWVAWSVGEVAPAIVELVFGRQFQAVARVFETSA
eukprot:409221-Lingulodinium_polyedra.AAC.1